MWVKKIKYCKLNIHKASHHLIFEGTYSRSTTYGSAIMISIMYLNTKLNDSLKSRR